MNTTDQILKFNKLYMYPAINWITILEMSLADTGRYHFGLLERGETDYTLSSL